MPRCVAPTLCHQPFGSNKAQGIWGVTALLGCHTPAPQALAGLSHATGGWASLGQVGKHGGWLVGVGMLATVCPLKCWFMCVLCAPHPSCANVACMWAFVHTHCPIDGPGAKELQLLQSTADCMMATDCNQLLVAWWLQVTIDCVARSCTGCCSQQLINGSEHTHLLECTAEPPCPKYGMRGLGPNPHCMPPPTPLRHPRSACPRSPPKCAGDAPTLPPC